MIAMAIQFPPFPILSTKLERPRFHLCHVHGTMENSAVLPSMVIAEKSHSVKRVRAKPVIGHGLGTTLINGTQKMQSADAKELSPRRTKVL